MDNPVPVAKGHTDTDILVTFHVRFGRLSAAAMLQRLVLIDLKLTYWLRRSERGGETRMKCVQ